MPSSRRTPRRAAVLVAALATAASTLTLTSSPSQADDGPTSVLTVVGTSDVYDSSLVQKVLKPGFEAAFPQYDLHYVSKGTGAAIAYAQAGTADAMIVHASALENQFVAPSGTGTFPSGTPSFSKEPYGRAIFWGDYVLLGPASDPANVLDAGATSHDIVTAFEKIAAAGEAGTADFVSRGGTPGTTVAEHAIWKDASNVTAQCTVKASDGGGTSPSTSNIGSSCPLTQAGATKIDYPAWYHATGLTQGPNITNANVCNYAGRSGKCYVLTDRGTFNNLQYEDITYPAAAPGLAGNLKVVTRDNTDEGARGGINLLINSFHAYVVNPDAKFPNNAHPNLNTTGATDFVSWMTSPAGQSLIGKYLKADPPFIPSASPTITASPVPASVKDGAAFTVSGTVKNVVPGTPALDGVTVNLQGVKTSDPDGTTPTTVATTTTDSSGDFSFTTRPTESKTYTLSTGSITKIEDATLNPVFGDLLAPASTSIGAVAVTGAPSSTLTASKPAAKVRSGQKVTVTGSLTDPTHEDAPLDDQTVSLLAVKSSTPTAVPKVVATGTTQADGSYSISHVPTASQRYSVKVGRVVVGPEPEDFLSATTATSGTVAVESVGTITSVTSKNGNVTIKGTLSPKVAGSKAHLSLYAQLSGDVKKKGLTYRAQKPLSNGATSYSVTFKLSAKKTWAFRLRYVNTGEVSPGYTRTVTRKIS